MKATLIALSAAVALAAGSSAALAAKKHHGGGLPEDPRIAAFTKQKGGWQSWCALSSSCNGWDAYFSGLKDHKKYAPPSMVLGKI